MIKFSEFTYSWSYHFASTTRDQVFGEDSFVDVKDFYTVDSTFEAKALAPSRETFLHLLISHCLEVDVEYVMSKYGPAQYAREELAPLFLSYGIEFPDSPEKYTLPKEEHPDDREYLWAYHLEELYNIHIVPRITEEVFTLMYADREALRKLNETIAAIVNELKVRDYPDLLEQDGKVKRCRYWPTWLRNALIYRDKGRCAICLCDLSGVLASGSELTIDHIVPLNLGGTNDPTNLQILCRDCNSSKSGNSTTTSQFQHVYWEREN